MTDAEQEIHQTQAGRHDGGIHDHPAEHSRDSGAQHSADRMSEMQGEALAKSKHVLQSGVEAATRHSRAASDRMTEALGFAGQGPERLAEQQEHLASITQCGAIFTAAIHEASHRWMESSQKQFQRNLDGLNKLARSKSLQEFGATQSELAREGIQEMLNDCRVITETSLKAVEKASKTLEKSSAGNA